MKRQKKREKKSEKYYVTLHKDVNKFKKRGFHKTFLKKWKKGLKSEMEKGGKVEICVHFMLVKYIERWMDE